MTHLSRLTVVLTLCLMGMLSALHAESVLLRTGQTIQGTILVENEQVVILQDKNGRRFQYMRSDIERIIHEQPVAAAEPTGTDKDAEQKNREQKTTHGGKRTSFLIEPMGGGSFVPNEKSGAMVGANIIIGSKTIKGRPLLLGGGVGYQAHIMPDKTYSILPIFFAARIPVLTGKHSPLVGLSVGYGVALSKSYLGGMHAGIDVGYQYTASSLALYIGMLAQFQQTTMDVVNTINEYEYKDRIGRSLVSTALKIGLRF